MEEQERTVDSGAARVHIEWQPGRGACRAGGRSAALQIVQQDVQLHCLMHPTSLASNCAKDTQD